MSRLRFARTSDEADLVELERTCFGGEAWSARSIRAELESDTRHVLVVDADQPIGYAVLSVVGQSAELLRIAVHPEHRRTGHARALVTEMVAEAERRDCDELLLEVRADNEPALRLYAEFGFETIARRRGYYDLGRVDALVLRRVRRQ